MTSTFYISNDDEADVQKCKESRDSRTSTTIIGRTIDGFIKPFTGVVQSVEHGSRARPRDTLARNYSRFMTEPKQPAGPAMTLGDMRELRRWGGSST